MRLLRGVDGGNLGLVVDVLFVIDSSVTLLHNLLGLLQNLRLEGHPFHLLPLELFLHALLAFVG